MQPTKTYARQLKTTLGTDETNEKPLHSEGNYGGDRRVQRNCGLSFFPGYITSKYVSQSFDQILHHHRYTSNDAINQSVNTVSHPLQSVNQSAVSHWASHSVNHSGTESVTLINPMNTTEQSVNQSCCNQSINKHTHESFNRHMVGDAS